MDHPASVRELIKEITGKEFADEQALLMTHLVDSMDVIAIAVAMEKRFGISIDGEEISFENFDTVNKMIVFTSKKVAQREAK